VVPKFGEALEMESLAAERETMSGTED
jgi:hypothetical protein